VQFHRTVVAPDVHSIFPNRFQVQSQQVVFCLEFGYICYLITSLRHEAF